MPELGDKIRGTELGYKNHMLYVYDECPKCHIRRWKRLDAIGRYKHCPRCADATRNMGVVLSKGVEWKRNESGDIVYKTHCPECRKMLWRLWRDRNRKCRSCGNLDKHRANAGGKWRGGRYVTAGGYVMVYITEDSPYFPMAMASKRRTDGKVSYLQEHRLVMARHLGRCLKPWEVVHHKNRDKKDNRIENLELLPKQAAHLSETFKDSHIEKLEKRVTELEKETRLLWWYIKNTSHMVDSQDSDIVQAP